MLILRSGGLGGGRKAFAVSCGVVAPAAPSPCSGLWEFGSRRGWAVRAPARFGPVRLPKQTLFQNLLEGESQGLPGRGNA